MKRQEGARARGTIQEARGRDRCLKELRKAEDRRATGAGTGRARRIEDQIRGGVVRNSVTSSAYTEDTCDLSAPIQYDPP